MEDNSDKVAGMGISEASEPWNELKYLREEALPFQRSRKPSPGRDRAIVRIEARIAKLTK